MTNQKNIKVAVLLAMVFSLGIMGITTQNADAMKAPTRNDPLEKNHREIITDFDAGTNGCTFKSSFKYYQSKLTATADNDGNLSVKVDNKRVRTSLSAFADAYENVWLEQGNYKIRLTVTDSEIDTNRKVILTDARAYISKVAYHSSNADKCYDGSQIGAASIIYKEQGKADDDGRKTGNWGLVSIGQTGMYEMHVYVDVNAKRGGVGEVSIENPSVIIKRLNR